MKSKLLTIGVIGLATLLVAGCTSGSVEGTDSIPTDNYANTQLEYYYYIPSTVIGNEQEAHPVLVMVPGLSGRGERFVTREFKKFADEEHFIIVAPSFVFDEDNWDSQQSYQYPSAWSGNALLEIINHLEEKHGITTSQMYLFGFSAGAQFALRFCLWKPELCIACAAHGSGGTVRPVRRVETRFFITVGSQDVSRIEKAKEFYGAARDLGIDVTYREYDTGHSLTSDQIKDSLDFFRNAE